MVTKTFKSETMIQTLHMVQAELGANAIVVSMRDVPLGPLWNPWQKSGVEVVATLPEPPAAKSAAPTTPILRPAENGKGVEFVEEMPEIEWEPVVKKAAAKLPPPLKLKSVSHPAVQTPEQVTVPDLLTEPAPKTVAKSSLERDQYLPPALKKIQEQLNKQGVEDSLIENLLHIALETLSPTTLADAEACKKSLIELMGAGLRVQKGAGTYISSDVVCVLGASGSGKTSTVAKLALFFSQKLNKKVTWVCADTVRTGAIAEARAYTDALGPELKLVYTPADLKDVFRNSKESDLFLVDTPGYNLCNESQVVELGALLEEMPVRCTYLVAPATTKESDLSQTSAALGMFDIDGLILTKLDETHSFGNLYNFARKNHIPLSFFTTGREAASNLEVANPARLVAALFGNEWRK